MVLLCLALRIGSGLKAISAHHNKENGVGHPQATFEVATIRWEYQISKVKICIVTFKKLWITGALMLKP